MARKSAGLVLVTALLATAAAPARAIDVDGDWQVNIDCGFFATATSFVTLDGDEGTGLVSATTPECGTLEVPGEIVEILACQSIPEPRLGLITGSVGFSVPSSGVFRSEATFEPFAFPFFGCPTEFIVSEHRYQGTITDGGSGVASRIAGTIVNTLLQVYQPGGAQCFSTPDTLDCQFDMRRNHVPAGAGVVVSPRAGATVTFDTVTSPGTAAVVPLTTPSASVPPGFGVLGGIPIYYDVRTTASWSGTVETCFSYPDANNDGIVDTNGFAEDSLRVLHDEDGQFVDRTSSLSTGANVICGVTTSLSQLTVAGEPAPPFACPGEPAAGCKRSLQTAKTAFLIKNKSVDAADQLQFKFSKGENTGPNDLGDPFNGAQYALCVYDESGPTPALVYAAQIPSALTCGSSKCWKGSPTFRRFKSSDGAPHGVRKLLFRTGEDGKAKGQVKARGAHLAGGPLGSPPLPLPIPARVQVLAENAACWEAEFGAAGVRRNDSDQFKAKATGP